MIVGCKASPHSTIAIHIGVILLVPMLVVYDVAVTVLFSCLKCFENFFFCLWKEKEKERKIFSCVICVHFIILIYLVMVLLLLRPNCKELINSNGFCFLSLLISSSYCSNMSVRITHTVAEVYEVNIRTLVSYQLQATSNI